MPGEGLREDWEGTRRSRNTEHLLLEDGLALIPCYCPGTMVREESITYLLVYIPTMLVTLSHSLSRSLTLSPTLTLSGSVNEVTQKPMASAKPARHYSALPRKSVGERNGRPSPKREIYRPSCTIHSTLCMCECVITADQALPDKTHKLAISISTYCQTPSQTRTTSIARTSKTSFFFCSRS